MRNINTGLCTIIDIVTDCKFCNLWCQHERTDLIDQRNSASLWMESVEQEQVKHNSAVQGETCRVSPGFTEPQPGSTRSICLTLRTTRQRNCIPLSSSCDSVCHYKPFHAGRIDLLLEVPKTPKCRQRPCIRHYSSSVNLPSCARCSNHDLRSCIPGPCGWSIPFAVRAIMKTASANAEKRSNHFPAAARNAHVQGKRRGSCSKSRLDVEWNYIGRGKYFAMQIVMYKLLFA
jgi:hypothetical protein